MKAKNRAKFIAELNERLDLAKIAGNHTAMSVIRDTLKLFGELAGTQNK